MTTVISVENLSKSYRLGQIGSGTFSNDLKLWWAKARGKPNPLLKIGEADHGNRDGEELMALRDVSFTVQQGEVLGIIGKNGAGKSTLLKILSRVTAPTSGAIKVKGRIASLLEVGTGFHPELTGRENIYLNGAILGMTRQEVDRKFDEIVDFAGVEKFIDTPVKRYSSGMYVRLAFAVAAHLEPEILVVDEVLAVGDAEFQKKCLGKMSDVAHEGRTVLFVSHNMASVSSLCDYCIWLERGKIKSVGETEQIVANYVNSTEQIGSTPLNLRTDRSGNGDLIFTNISIIGNEGIKKDNFLCGEKLTIILDYKKNEVVPLKNVKVGLLFWGTMGQYIFSCKSDLTYGTFDDIFRKGKFKCIIPELPLAPGLYSISVWARSSGKWLDSVDLAAYFRVEAGDFFGSGKLPDNRQGVLVRHSWETMNNEEGATI